MTTQQQLYGGVKYPVNGLDLDNIERLDMGAKPLVHRMMQTGLQVDLSHFEMMHKTLTQDMDRITEKVRDLTGYYINVGSGDQVADLLFKKLGLKQARPQMTKTGDRESVVHEVLVAIQHDHEVVPHLLEYKEVEKLDGTYVKPIPRLARRTKFGVWKMYPNLGDSRVPSGRLNSREPNLLAMPNRTKRGRQLCEGFITSPGWVYLSVDLSQIEPRLAAHLSQDKNLLRIYHNDEDIYSDFATAAFRLKDERWECSGYTNTTNGNTCDNKEHLGHGWHYPTVHKKDQRFPAKACILASIYEVSAKGLLEQMPIICANCLKEATKHNCGSFSSLWTEDKCQDLINAFYLTYPGVLADRLKNHRIAKRLGYITDMWGRCLHVAAVRSIHPWVVSAALREVSNFPYQAGSQGPVKLVSAHIEDDFVEEKIWGDVANPLLLIHDEWLLETREDMAQEVGEHIVYRCQNCVELSIPLKAGMATAECWGKLEK